MGSQWVLLSSWATPGACARPSVRCSQHTCSWMMLCPSLGSQLQARPGLQNPFNKVPSGPSFLAGSEHHMPVCSAGTVCLSHPHPQPLPFGTPISEYSTTLHPAHFPTQALHSHREQRVPAKSMHTSETLGLAEQAVVRGRRERAIIGLQESACAVGRKVSFLGVNTSPGSFFRACQWQ